MAFTVVASAASATALLSANAARTAVIIANTDAAILYILIAGTGTVSTTNFSVPIASGGYFVVPETLARERITGIWAADGSGSAMITTDA